jgi:hypothetical protein
MPSALARLSMSILDNQLGGHEEHSWAVKKVLFIYMIR